MRFGRVEGTLEQELDATGNASVRYRLRVNLETSREWTVIRDEIIAPPDGVVRSHNLAWLADQYTQETIGVDLAEQGWEVIGANDLPEPEPNEIIRSATYAVRQL